jgi:hypothetical protein
MTEFQIISSVMNLVTSNEGVTNLSLSEEQVGDEVDTLRGRMIGELDGQSLFRSPYTGFAQTIDRLGVTKATASAKPFVDIPRVMFRRDNTPAIAYIGGIDLKSPYRIVTGINVENFEHMPYTGKFPIAHYNEGRVTIYNANPNLITIIGVFNDPGDLEILGKYNAETSEYPFPIGMIDQLIGKTSNSYLNTLYRILPQPNTQSDLPASGNAGSKRK